MLPPAQNSPVAPRWPQTNASSSTWYRERLCPHLWLPLSLDPHYSLSSTRQTKLLSLCFNLVISCILFLLLKCLASFPCHYGQHKLLPFWPYVLQLLLRFLPTSFPPPLPASGRLLNLSVTRHPLLKNGANNITCLMGWSSGLNETKLSG